MNQTTAIQSRAAANGNLEVLDAIRDDIATLVRAGGKDSAQCTKIAVATLMDLRNLTKRQAWKLWMKYA